MALACPAANEKSNHVVEAMLECSCSPAAPWLWVTFSSIVSPAPVCSTAQEPGRDYIAVTQAVGGEWASICDDDWTPLLEALGLFGSGLDQVWPLSRLPVPGTLGVTVDEGGVTYEFAESVDYDFEQVGNLVRFHQYIPAPAAEVHLEYEPLVEH